MDKHKYKEIQGGKVKLSIGPRWQFKQYPAQTMKSTWRNAADIIWILD